MAIPPLPTDQELDVYIKTRYALRVLSSARSTLMQDREIAAYPTNQQADVPTFYPVPFAQWTGGAQ
jgi:hypothetical protein